ncbi:hypothetical protein JY412_04020 [Stenotrophomonas maltophilia]|nr:hypothetical protein [Stenotrophomonas maltophilia]
MGCIYNCADVAAGIDWAAWVQAVGSVVGIAVAIYVPWRQRQHLINDERLLRQDKIKLMRTALEAAARQYKGSLAAAFHFLEMDHAARKQVPEDGPRRPTEFDQFRPDLYLLGDLGEQINRLIASHTTMEGAFKAINSTPNLSKEFLDFSRKQFPELIDLANEVARQLRQ